MLYLIIRSLAVVLFKLLFGLQAFGRENVPLKGGVILAGNHVSYLDPPVVAAASPRIVYFLAKENLFRGPFFGPFIRSLHAFPVKARAADLKAMRWSVESLKKGKTIIVFPEGGRSFPDQPEKPLAGVGFLAVRANVPIVPTFLEGTYQAMPQDSKCVHPFTRIKVYFGTPIYPQDVNAASDKERYEALANKTMEAITALKMRQK